MDSYNYSNLFNGTKFLYAIVAILVIWLLLREVRNWYWKHNDMIFLMQEISEKLTILDNSIHKQSNDDTKIEVTLPRNTYRNEEVIMEKVIKEELIEKKSKESIWTRKLF